jgi:MinD superfamily P-loop ATPase
MKKLLLLSGKGGTGKTTLAGAFVKMADARAYADCDVDAPNLHLILAPETNPMEMDFFGLDKAVIDPLQCTDCGLCEKVCRFDAIRAGRVDTFSCEGCGVCVEFCPEGAIAMTKHIAGKTALYKEEDTVFSTAHLKMGSGNSGKLVTEVKKQLYENADQDALAIIDGSPGIGCPVIASITGTDMVLMVAEPSVSGMSDLKRIVKTAKMLRARVCVCINKWDLNNGIARKIESYCREEEIDFLGRIPYDPKVIRELNRGRSIAEAKNSPAEKAIRNVFLKTVQILFKQ